MQVKISRPEAYSLMSETDHEIMNERIKEVEHIAYLNKETLDLQFYFDEERNELIMEISSQEQKVLYRLMFKIKRNVGRPSLGTTKKVSLTLPDEIWGKINDIKKTWEVNQSHALRAIIERYFDQLDELEGRNKNE